MPNRTKILLTILALVVIAWGVFAWLARWPMKPYPLVHILRVYMRLRPPVVSPQAPSPAAQPLPPSATAPPSVPPTTPPPVPSCTTAQTPPSGAKAPAPSSSDYGGEPIGVGRGYLEGSEPTYSPDGREIAFEHDSYIWIISVDGQNLRQLTTNKDPDQFQQAGSPAWSPDGSRIAFEASNIPGTRHIWVIHTDGSNLTQLTIDPAGDWAPVWSPDSAKIAFMSKRGESENIWIMNADGTDPVRVTDGSVEASSRPAFSPDGRQLVFSQQDSNLMIVDVDGKGRCQLTTDNSDRDPHWSVRGIVFARSGSGQHGLWLIQPDGSGLQVLQGADGSNPVWSPDVTRIAFNDYEHIYVFNLITRKVKPMTQLNALSIVIYIKPGVANTINPKTEGSIPVAILSAPWFDPVRQLDRASITFGPTGNERAPASCIEDDVNEDGAPDLVCQFDVAASFSHAHTEGILKAKGVNGIVFEGRDAVKVESTP